MHKDDLLFRTAEFINELSFVQDLSFESLVAETINPNHPHAEELREYLSDYVFGGDSANKDFGEFLLEMNREDLLEAWDDED